MIKVIILAAGTGERFSEDTPKQFVKLAGLPLIVHTLKVFQNHQKIDKIIVVTNEQYINFMWDLVNKYNLGKVEKVVAGGKTRQESSYIGLKVCDNNTKYVLIHDGVRPFVSFKIIDKLIDAVKKYKAVDTVICSADTIVKVDENNFIKEIPERKFLRRGQTPQAFDYNLILSAHQEAIKSRIENSTDDCFLILRLGYPVYVVEGEEQNIKITYPIDLHIADKLFQLKHESLQDISNLKEKAKGRVFVIIGGTSGIGQALSKKIFILEGTVYPLSRSSEIKIDITDDNSIKMALIKILEKERKIDYIVNCAGDLIKKDVIFMNENEWDYIYNVNVKGAFLLSKVAIPIFQKQGYGTLIFIGSSAYTRGRSGYAAYSSSKAALVNFVQALAEEVTEYNIKVNIAVPTRVNTPLRFRNFGKEDPSTLLSPEYVAEKIIQILFQDTTGSVFEIR